MKKELIKYGFTMNPYDMWVDNKIGHQLTVLWHVDDLKISCKNPFELTKLLCYLEGIYGDKIIAHRGNKGNYLGMDLDFTEKGVSQVSTLNYIGEIFAEAITKSAPAPQNENLFKVRDENEAKFLPDEQALRFHRTTAQLFFLSMHARRDIQAAVSFLTSWVKKPDEDNWGKLRRVLQYLKGVRSLKLRITVDDLCHSKWFIDASHMVHRDCKGQTGAGMTLGKSALLCYSWKQKVNTKSTADTELVSVDDSIGAVLWSL